MTYAFVVEHSLSTLSCIFISNCMLVFYAFKLSLFFPSVCLFGNIVFGL